MNGVFNFDNSTLFLAEDRLAHDDITDLVNTFAGEGAVRAGYQYSSSGELIPDPSSLNGNGLVANSVALYRERSVQQIMSDTRFNFATDNNNICLLYTSPSPRDGATSRMPSSA